MYRRLLSISLAVLLMAGITPAQDLLLPDSTRLSLAITAHLDALAPSDVRKVISGAQSSDREAQYLLALVYGQGRLVPKDDSTALKWMLKSAEAGYMLAQAGMGKAYLHGVKSDGAIQHYGEAERWLQLAAAQGNADAQFWLGIGYRRGYFGAVDHREALQWLNRAATQGQPDAQYCLGQIFEDGDGVIESASVAAGWYRKAADHFPQDLGGVWQAENELAIMYRERRLPENWVEAYMWFAIIASSSSGSANDDVKWAAQHMTAAQIAEAQKSAKDWVRRHTLTTSER